MSYLEQEKTINHMIKFFRRIRKKLLEENHLSKYLIYAAGEIILVMIGILLALQVNNWNENRKDRQKERAILIELRKDYLSNLDQLEEKIAARKRIVNSSLKVLRSIDNPANAVRDSLIRNFAELANDPTFDPIQNDLISSGNIRLIKDENLKRLLSNWSSDVIALTEVEAIWSDISNHELNSAFKEIGIARDVINSFESDINHNWVLDKSQEITRVEIGSSKQSTPLKTILQSKDLEAMAAFAINYSIVANTQSEALINRIKEILELTDESLK